MPIDVLTSLRTHFGFTDFRDGQREVIDAILNGKSAVVVMPTGSGKSVCYQLPAMIMEGATLVVSPLIALMKDQVDALRERGLPATFINSSINPTEQRVRIEDLRQGRYKLIYVAPERFRSGNFVSALKSARITLFAVDEAHCISTWGHDFRPDYLNLRNAIELLGGPQTLALTATATPYVRADIIQQLGLNKPETFVSGFDRPNLRLEVIHTNTDRQKISTINHLAQAHDGSGIIYTTTRKAVEHVAEELQWNGLTVAAYHAGMKDSVRVKAQEDFMKGKTQMIVATNAFGMGIDKPDIRFVVHYQMPGSIEAYYQEIGRAGRDGLTSSCVLLFSYADKNTHDFFIDGSYPSSQTVKDVYQALVATGLKRIELTVPELAQRADAKNEMSVQSALYLLERAGHIVRSDASDRRDTATHRKRSIVMLDATPTKNLRVNFRDVERRADIERAKLREMIDLCYSEYCYRADVLNYFGDRHHAQRCGMCGNCVPHASPRMKFEHEAKSGRSKTGKRTTASIPARPITAAENLCARKILACAARMGGRFGKNMLISTLRGSAAQNIIEAKLNELSTYGLLREMRKEEVLLYVEALLDARCLKITGSEYPMVSTTELGQRVMREQEQVELRLPPEGEAVESETRFRPAKTAFETLALFQQGLSTEEIARRREMVAGTIEAHLTDCLRAGFPVDTSRLVAAEDRKEILQAIAIHGTERLKPIKESLPERISFNAIRFVVVEHQLREKQKAAAAK